MVLWCGGDGCMWLFLRVQSFQLVFWGGGRWRGFRVGGAGLGLSARAGFSVLCMYVVQPSVCKQCFFVLIRRPPVDWLVGWLAGQRCLTHHHCRWGWGALWVFVLSRFPYEPPPAQTASTHFCVGPFAVQTSSSLHVHHCELVGALFVYEVVSLLQPSGQVPAPSFAEVYAAALLVPQCWPFRHTNKTIAKPKLTPVQV